MKSKTPKIISGIAMMISLIALAFIFLSSFWFWVLFEIVAALAVMIGCGGEWYLHHHPSGKKRIEKEEHHKLESRFIGAVVIGVTMELLTLGHSIREGVKLEEKVALANERAATNEFMAEQFRAKADALEKEISETQTNVASLNPATQLVHSLTASAQLRFTQYTGPDRQNEFFGDELNFHAQMSIGQGMGKILVSSESAVASSVFKEIWSSKALYNLSFSTVNSSLSPRHNGQMFAGKSAVLAAEDLTEIILLISKFPTNGTVYVNGRISVLFNENHVIRDFIIENGALENGLGTFVVKTNGLTKIQ